jgi:deoxycytidylate deaminase|tara:strand:- start:510 stop:947 length:438 start_codon:yes stop_codon:yes gene_type:complete
MESDPSRKINKYLRLALRRIDGEEYSNAMQYRHSAVIVKGGRVLSVGRNRNKTHPDSVSLNTDGELYCRSIHAEMDAISRVKNKDILRGAIIYVARKSRTGLPGMSCPCKMCQGQINKYGLKRAVFTTDYGTGTLEFTGEQDDPN